MLVTMEKESGPEHYFSSRETTQLEVRTHNTPLFDCHEVPQRPFLIDSTRPAKPFAQVPPATYRAQVSALAVNTVTVYVSN